MDVDAPYLPPAEPTDNLKPTKRRLRLTLVSWVVLIVLFVGIYQLLGDGTPHPHAAAPRAPEPQSLWWPWLQSVALLAGTLGLAIFLMWRQLRGGAKLNAKLEPGLIALADGDVGRAVDVFAAVAHEYRKQTMYAAVAKVSLARAWMRQGQLQKAIDVAIEVERAPGLVFGAEARLHASVDLATLYALRGDVETARRWCESVRQRLVRAQNRTATAAMARLAEALVLARAGQRQEALRALERDWRRLEDALTATTMKSALLVRAFCDAGDANRGSAGPWLALLRKGELSWMAAEWPELRTFLAAHELS